MLEKFFQEVLDGCGSAVKINGGAPWDIQVKDKRFYRRMFWGGSLALGETYMDGWWDAQDLEGFISRILNLQKLFLFFSPAWLIALWRDQVKDLATVACSRKVAQVHYDLGEDLFCPMLGPTMAYSCAYWQEAWNLDAAQQAKLDLICRKLKLNPGERVLDIGCGWGSFARYAAEKYQVSVTGITVSTEQARFARERCSGLPVQIEVKDYRDCKLEGRFDKIVSVGMFEHVEPRHYKEFFTIVRRSLRSDGLFLLHTIGKEKGNCLSDPWIRKYIFPAGMIPSVDRLALSYRETFHCLDWHYLGGEHYAQTLRAWRSRFLEAWPKLEPKYGSQAGGRFRRMWEYYLSVCTALFAARSLDVFQLVLAPKDGPERGYFCAR